MLRSRRSCSIKLSRRAVIAMTLATSARAVASPCCGPVGAAGARLAAFLDSTGVDHLWLPGFRVNWETGAPIATWDDGRRHTHCSAFVASAAMRLGIYILRPPQHSAVLLANAQMRWLRTAEAASMGWQPLRDVISAQARANLGDLVLAVFENPDRNEPGHIAIVRPDEIDAETLLRNGPFVTQAGGHNALSEPLASGFRNHPGAWVAGGSGSVRFFAHAVNRTVLG
jgi:hypothetical protein